MTMWILAVVAAFVCFLCALFCGVKATKDKLWLSLAGCGIVAGLLLYLAVFCLVQTINSGTAAQQFIVSPAVEVSVPKEECLYAVRWVGATKDKKFVVLLEDEKGILYSMKLSQELQYTKVLVVDKEKLRPLEPPTSPTI